MSGVLYGVGLGPGDPELITLKAARLIAGAKVVAYPALTGGESFARSIASGMMSNDTVQLIVEIPMTQERAPAQEAYDRAARDISSYLKAEKDVVYLCEGDPFFYGSFMYIYSRLSDQFRVEVVPGVTSITACAAKAGKPLVARNERLTVLPGPLPEDELRLRIEGAESLAIMKVGRHLRKIRQVIGGLGLLEQSVYIERVSLPDERICQLADAPDEAPYFSMILLTKGADPWL